MKLYQRILALILILAALALPAPAAGAYVPTYSVDTTIRSEAHDGQKNQVAKGFAIASRVLRGDASGTSTGTRPSPGRRRRLWLSA